MQHSILSLIFCLTLKSALSKFNIATPTSFWLMLTLYVFLHLLTSNLSVLLYLKLDYKESWVPKNWWFQTVVLEKTLETSLDSKESKSVSPKGNEPWIFIGGNDSEALMLWSPDVKGQLSGKDPDAGKDWRPEEKGVTENKMFGCIIDPVDMSLSKLQEIVRDWESDVLYLMRSQSWTQLSTELY